MGVLLVARRRFRLLHLFRLSTRCRLLQRAGQSERPGDDPVCHRLPPGNGSRLRQHLCHRHGVHLLRRAARVSAPGPVLGHHRRDRVPGDLYFAGRRDRQRVHLGALHLRRFPALHGRQDAAVGQRRRRPHGPQRQSGPEIPEEADAGDRHDREPQFRRAQTSSRDRQDGALGHAAAAVRDHGRSGGHHLCRRLGTGDLRGHPRSVHRLHLEHLRHPRPAFDVFSCWRLRSSGSSI